MKSIRFLTYFPFLILSHSTFRISLHFTVPLTQTCFQTDSHRQMSTFQFKLPKSCGSGNTSSGTQLTVVLCSQLDSLATIDFPDWITIFLFLSLSTAGHSWELFWLELYVNSWYLQLYILWFFLALQKLSVFLQFIQVESSRDGGPPRYSLKALKMVLNFCG